MQIAASAYHYPLLIRHLLHTPLACRAHQEIVSGLERRYDYLTFRERIARLAGALERLGVGPGSTVAVMDWDGHRYLECFFAVPMMGARLHTINVRLSPEQILYTVNHAADDVILVHEDFAPLLAQIAPRFERPLRTVLLSDAGAPSPSAHDGEYEALLANVPADFAFADFDENTPATTFYTTGTTGEPKGVEYTHRQLVLHTLGLLAGFAPVPGESRLHRDDVYMPITPMFHVHGWGFPYAATLLGMKQVYPGRYEPATLLRLIEREGVTFSHCVPTILHLLLNAPEARDVDLSRMKIVIGGSALPQGLAAAARERGIDVFAAYGLSETCPFLTVADVQQAAESELAARCRTGKPGPLVELRVVDENLRDVARDGHSTGEVVVRAPWLTQGYAGSAEGSEALWRGGYLHTGDVGHLDASGSLQITDRMKDVIKSGGEWISSLALESIASQCAGVGEVAAIGVPDERWGERPMLLVVRGAPSAAGAATAEDIRAAIAGHVDSGRLSRWAVPERIEFVDALDKTSVGKLDKKALRARYAGG